MELDISGAKIFFTLPTDIPILGDFKLSETIVVTLDRHGADHRSLHLADP